MAENNSPLSIVIDADISKLQKAISSVKESIGEISFAIKNTDLGDFGKDLEKSLLQINTRLDELESNFKKTTTSSKTFVTGSKDARSALTSLSLVAQDAPFGFIAIQNNLPGVIASFGTLSTASKGLTGTLVALKTALIGPAGIFLAFSVVTGAITFAIQKYGSLSEAYRQLSTESNEFSSTILSAKKSLDEYNKSAKSVNDIRATSVGSVQDEILKVQTLANVLSDSTTSDNNKKRALAELKRTNDEYFGNLNAQKIDLDALNKSVGAYSESLIKTAVAQGIASEAASAFTEFLKQNQIAFDISQKINKLFKDVPSLTKELQDYTNKRDKLLAAGELTAIRFIPISKELNQYFLLNNQFKELNDRVLSTAKSYGTLKTQAESAFKEASNFFDLEEEKKGKGRKDKIAKNEFTLGIDPQELDAAFNLDKIISNVTKLGNTILDTNKPLKERQDALKELVAINPQVFNGLTLEKNGLTTLKGIVEEYIKSLQVLIKQREFDARASQINTQFRNAQTKATEDAVKAEEDAFENLVKLTYAQDQYGNSTDKIIQKNKDFVNGLKELQDINEGVIDILTKGLNFEGTYNKAIENLLKFGEFTKKTADGISKNLRFLQEPLEGLFTTILEKGSASWKSFADEVIKQVKRIAASLVSKALIKGLSFLISLLSGGASGLVTAGLKGISTDVLGEFLDASGGSKINFGGIQGGGMQMSGQVVFIQRGSDLVGVLNRTNGTINRVG